MPTALLTGGTGFVGGHVARALVDHGWAVRLLARGHGRTDGALLKGVPVEEVIGDLSDVSVLESAAAGVDAVVHVAGLLKARTLEEYREVNVRGTERLLAAAERAAPGALFFYLSSQAAAGPARDGRLALETDVARPVSWYGLSKREGEEVVAHRWRGAWIVLRPGVVYGPGDRGLFVYFRMAAAGWVPVPAGRARIQIVGVDQVALAVVRALERRDLAGRTGFLCDPEPLTVRRLAAAIARLPSRPATLVSVPDALVRLLGLGETFLETVTRRSYPFNADKAREILAGDWLCDGAPTREALSLPTPVPLEEGLRATWAWYRKAGWLSGGAL